MRLRRLSMAYKYINYRLGRLQPGCYPYRLYLESTNACNLRCVMCPRGIGKMRREQGFMEFKLFRSIVDEMAPYVTAMTLHIWGEPLLHPRIVDMVRYAKRYPARVELSTNAVLLEGELAEELLRSGLDMIYLCLDGADASAYERIRRQASYERTRGNIERFIERKLELGLQKPSIQIQIVEMQPTRDQIELFKRQWTRPGVKRINVKAFDSWAGQVEEINELRPSQHGAPLPPRRWPCPNLWYHAHVYWDGTLVCCDRDFDASYPLGNVGEEGGVMRVWRGERMARLRAKHLTGELDDVPSCSRCTEWSWWYPGWFRARGNAPMRNSSAKTAKSSAMKEE